MIELTRKLALIAGLLLQSMCGALRSMPASVEGHALVFQRMEGGLATLATPPMHVKTDSIVFVAGVGRGDVTAFVPPQSGKHAAAFTQLGETHTYSLWPRSGTALYTSIGGKGDEDHVISIATPPRDEITMAAVAVTGTKVVDFAWNEVLAGSPVTSRKVTTTGPATLVAFWWGDGGVKHEKWAAPDNGFKVIERVLEPGALVQCAVAVRRVDAAGSYDVTWLSRPVQGAQLWLVAVE